MGSRKEVASPSSASPSSGSQDMAISGRPALYLSLFVNLFVEFGDCDLEPLELFIISFVGFIELLLGGILMKWFFTELESRWENIVRLIGVRTRVSNEFFFFFSFQFMICVVLDSKSEKQ